jgi:hypothetical protein
MNYGWETKTTVFEEKKEKKISPPPQWDNFHIFVQIRKKIQIHEI